MKKRNNLTLCLVVTFLYFSILYHFYSRLTHVSASIRYSRKLGRTREDPRERT